MELTILYDNQTLNSNYESDWGFSCLINNTVLFDTGARWDILKRNAELAGVDFSTISTVVISHDHWDHTGGLWDLLKVSPGLKVVGCPGFSSGFKEAVKAASVSYFDISRYSIIDSRIYSTGGIAGSYKGDNLSEQSIVIQHENGIGIITGCAHPGIIRIVEQVQLTLKNASIEFLLGGFHLKDKTDDEIETLAESLNSMGIRRVGSCHCSGMPAQNILKKIYGANYLAIGPGTVLEVP